MNRSKPRPTPRRPVWRAMKTTGTEKNGGDKLPAIWQKWDIVARMCIPLILALMTYLLTSNQANIQRSQSAAEKNIRILELIFKEMLAQESEDRLAVATKLIEAMEPPDLRTLRSVLKSKPEQGVRVCQYVRDEGGFKNEIREEANKVYIEIMNDFIITDPLGETIGFPEEIKGKSPFSKLSHYLLVQPESGSEYVDCQVILSDGFFNATPIYKPIRDGVGKLSLRVIATYSKLDPSSHQIPDAAISSPSIISYKRLE
jgi:hypothetical protein